jgi:ABC-type sugar transport system substrate-binding protein
VRRRTQLGLLCICLPVVAILAAGCGSSGGSGSTASGSTESVTTTASKESSGSGELATIEAKVKELSVRPTSIGKLPKITKPIPKGKKIAFLSGCGESCEQQFRTLKEGAEVLGWTASLIDDSEATPEAVKAAWEQALRTNPDGIVQAGGLPHEYYESELAQARDRNIPVVTMGDSQPKIPGIASSVEVKRYALNGINMADWIIAATGGEANVVIQNIPAYEGIDTQSKELAKELESKCPGCTVKTYEMPVTESNFASATASQVQAEPNTNYLATAFGDFTVGMPAALAAVGAEDVPIITQVQNSAVIQYLQKDEDVAAVYGYPGPEVAWRAVDAFARVFTGSSPEVDETTPWPEWFITAEQVTPEIEAGFFPLVKNYQEQFKELWTS